MKNKKQYIGKFLENDYNHFKDGLLELLDDYKRKSQRLDKIIKQSDRTQMQLLKANEQLDEYKNNLEQKVEEEIEKREEKEKILLEQSRLAAMGEMIDSIAHQWAQPLSILSMYNQSLEYDFDEGKIDKEYIENFQEKVSSTINHMNSTLNEFRTFFRPKKESESFNINDILSKTLCLIKDEFKKDNITFDIKIPEEFKFIGIDSEFKHIILNIINNSRDAFIFNGIENRNITINAYKKDGFHILEINDNAGGISPDILEDIFKANFTTKGSKGSGIGLYMSCLIAQKNNILLSVKNIKNGVKFILKQRIEPVK